MKKHLNQKFSVGADSNSLILYENQSGNKVRRHYFSNIKMMSHYLGDRISRDFIAKSNYELGDNFSIAPRYDSLIKDLESNLEVFIESIQKDK